MVYYLMNGVFGGTNIQSKKDLLGVFIIDSFYCFFFPYILGAYITTEEVLKASVLEDCEKLWTEGNFEKAIALRAVKSLIVDRGSCLLGRDIFDGIVHGTAVWCLSSTAKDEVRYHIDYGELHRYETNIIYPPLYAGTCHLSPLSTIEDIDGGAFKANLNGVEHYRKFGYKCKILLARFILVFCVALFSSF
jgi:hypothetical protein